MRAAGMSAPPAPRRLHFDNHGVNEPFAGTAGILEEQKNEYLSRKVLSAHFFTPVKRNLTGPVRVAVLNAFARFVKRLSVPLKELGLLQRAPTTRGTRTPCI